MRKFENADERKSCVKFYKRSNKKRNSLKCEKIKEKK